MRAHYKIMHNVNTSSPEGNKTAFYRTNYTLCLVDFLMIKYYIRFMNSKSIFAILLLIPFNWSCNELEKASKQSDHFSILTAP